MAGACVLDATTLRSLEICRTIRAAAGASASADALDGSLLGIFTSCKAFNGCATVMGKRLLREWLCRPLYDLQAIEGRQSCIATLVSDRQMASGLSEALKSVQDVARIAGRLALGRATPRDLSGLGCSLRSISPISEALENAPAFASQLEAVRALEAALKPLGESIAALCIDSPPGHMREGGLIRDGADAELDEARRLQRDAAGWMAEYQAKLVSEHDLPSLKVGYNKIFGYYIELPTAQSRRAPDQFTRKQTLKNAERYITPELKEFETKVLTAESRALAREVALFESLCDQACAVIPSIGRFADVASELDVLGCLAEKASKRRWVRPEMTERSVLVLRQARHPVLDEKLDGSFVPNDVELGSSALTADGPGEERPMLGLITGPNMAGKSTFIRTAALVTLLAHVGSFVPADAAVVGLTDRIFTRIGADDALHAGQSTFMVEMTETARILNHCTGRSLVILDEIGRGTSTLDGLSLAWAIAETLGGRGSGEVAEWQSGQVNSADGSGPSHSATQSLGHSATSSPRTLFATHYHELTDLQELLPGRVQNLHVAVREWGEEIVFLHRILPGRTDQSYGIHVAKLAGLPSATITRARQVLESIAVHHQMGAAANGVAESSDASVPNGNGKSRRSSVNTKRIATSVPPPAQLSLFTEYVQHPVVDELREMKLDGLTPLQAFDALRRLYELTKQGEATAR
jgi:DNA mismatch repair protein MutS